MGAYCKHVIDIDREFWSRDMPGESYQVIIQVDSEMPTLSDSWYPCTAFKSDRYTDTHLVILAVIQQYENLKIYWENRDAFDSSHCNWKILK